MQRLTEVMFVVCAMLVMTSYVQQTTAAPSWRPQGRFGKRGDTASFAGDSRRPYYWRPQGRYGKRSTEDTEDVDSVDAAKTPAFGGEIELPVEFMSARDRADTMKVMVKLCTLTGVDGFSPCTW